MSDQGPIIVRENTGSNVGVLLIVLCVLVIAAAGIFVWRPWSVTSTTHQTTVTQPNSNGGANGSSSSTTTTSNGHP